MFTTLHPEGVYTPKRGDGGEGGKRCYLDIDIDIVIDIDMDIYNI